MHSTLSYILCFFIRLVFFGLSDGYVNWFRSYLSIRKSQIRVSKILSSHFEVFSGVPQGSVLGPLLFWLFITDLYDAFKCSMHLISDDNIKIYGAIKSPEDYNILQSDINSIIGCCTANCMTFAFITIEVLSFSKKPNILIYEYKFFQFSVLY
jgi:hypothetical protein